MTILIVVCCLIPALATMAAAGDDVDPLAPWRGDVRIRPVCAGDDAAHTIHTYFNVSPESPDGRYVLFWRSVTADAHAGDICVIERATGKQTVLARGVRAMDAHRAACQQWVSNGRRIVYEDERDGHRLIIAVDVDGGNKRVLARDRLAGFGQPHADLVPLFGPYWELTEHRDLELLDVETGQIRTVITNDAVRAAYPDWIKDKFGDRPTTVFFGILSPDRNRVIFKLSTPASGQVQTADASARDGLICYDLAEKRFCFLQLRWGHPSWHTDSKILVQQRLQLINSDNGETRTIPNLHDHSGTHPTTSPDGTLLLSDAILSVENGKAKEWGIVLADVRGLGEIILHRFDNSGGATSWRRSHPHPVFSADGRRIYFNVSNGRWTRLFVAELPEDRARQK